MARASGRRTVGATIQLTIRSLASDLGAGGNVESTRHQHGTGWEGPGSRFFSCGGAFSWQQQQPLGFSANLALKNGTMQHDPGGVARTKALARTRSLRMN